jgi:hypothetical protein
MLNGQRSTQSGVTRVTELPFLIDEVGAGRCTPPNLMLEQSLETFLLPRTSRT